MTVVLDLKDLLTAVRRVTPALGTERPIFGGIRIEIIDETVHVDAHDGERYFRAAYSSANSSDLRAVILPGRLLSRFLRVMEPSQYETVDLAVGNGDEVRLRSGDAALTTKAFDVESWQKVEIPATSGVVLTDADLHGMRAVAFAASSAVERGPLVGVHLSGRGATATDQERLAQARLDVDLQECLVPGGFLRDALKVTNGAVGLVQTERSVFVSDGGGIWSSALMNLKFPDVRSLLDRPITARLVAETDGFLRAVEHVSVLESARVIVSSNGEGSAVLSVVDDQIGDVVSALPASGDWIGKVQFDRKHLLEAVQHHDNGDLQFDFTGEDKPVSIRGDRLLQVLMTRSC